MAKPNDIHIIITVNSSEVMRCANSKQPYIESLQTNAVIKEFNIPSSNHKKSPYTST